jgi:putative tricarboxylic transport membrane protein
MTIIFLVLLAIILGLIGGLLPGLGNTVIIFILYSFLIDYPPEYVILFYAVLIQANTFSSSVSAINLGLLGDITSEPALRERGFLIKHNLVKTSLKFTAISSVYACVISVCLFYLILNWVSENPIILRTELRFFILWILTFAIIFWPNNGNIKNLFLLIIGVMLTVIGHHEFFLGFHDIQILTFNLPALHGGLPTISILSAFLAVPALLKLHTGSKVNINSCPRAEKEIVEKFNFFSSVRGSLIGSFLGAVPMIGAAISSNIAWICEKRFSKNNTKEQQSLNRLTSAEAANNSANVIVLIPMLIFGIAIIPSEMILLSILESKAWTPNLSTSFYYSMFLAILFSCLMSYLACYTFVSMFTELIKKYLSIITMITIILMISGLWYAGWLVDTRVTYILTFLIFSTIVVVYKNVDYLPLVVGFLLGDELIKVTDIFYKLHF